MISYLLLRSNKESGPYSLDELINFGLKPYDLVWVNGKSAAWRYPSEVAELKPYSPLVEEQPFDRFFKKSTEQKQEEPIPVALVQAKEEQVIPAEKQYQPRIVKEESKPYIPKKSVFVTLPGKANVAAQQPVMEEPVSSYVPPATVIIKENPVTAELKFSQPLDEIKEMYVKTLQDRKSKIARKSFIKINLRRAAAIAGLVGIGVLAGFIIKPRGAKNPETANPSVASVLPAQTGIADKDSVMEPIPAPEVSGIIIPPVEEKDRPAETSKVIEKRNTNFSEKELSEQPAETSILKKNKKEPAASTEEKAGAEEEYSYSATEKNPVTGERNKTVRNNNNNYGNTTPVHTEEKAGKSAGKTGFESQVFVTSNDYKKVAFGGIRDLRLTVTNNSKYELDNVIVELQYLKPSEQPLKTEKIYFKGIAANESSTIKVPDTNRGIKVTYRILSIGSKQSREDVAGK